MDYCPNPNPVIPTGLIPKCGTIWWTVGFRGDVRKVMCQGEKDSLVSVLFLEEPYKSKFNTSVCLEKALFNSFETAQAFAEKQRKEPLTDWQKKVLDETYGQSEWKA